MMVLASLPKWNHMVANQRWAAQTLVWAPARLSAQLCIVPYVGALASDCIFFVSISQGLRADSSIGANISIFLRILEQLILFLRLLVNACCSFETRVTSSPHCTQLRRLESKAAAIGLESSKSSEWRRTPTLEDTQLSLPTQLIR